MSGAPFNNTAQGDINKFVLSELSEMKGCIGRMEGDIREIKTFIADKKQASSNSNKLKATIAGSLIMGLSGIIVAVISLFKSA